ncbi:MAG: hypothetical protein JNG86_10160 [Verrucomicrobiaceae bacterium]|nr:hypothetical protein [Verrucomicrobiaceae bacterium]
MNTRFVPAIQKPCPMSWDSMQGDEKRRFCEHCQLHVHNLSEMTTQEQVTLMRSPGERKCITYTAPTNAKPVDAGTWLTLQTTAGWRRAIAALLAAGFSMFSVGCQNQRTTGTPMPMTDPKAKLGKMEMKAETPRMNGEAPAITKSGKAPMMLGVMMEERPWWKKVLFME